MGSFSRVLSDTWQPSLDGCTCVLARLQPCLEAEQAKEPQPAQAEGCRRECQIVQHCLTGSLRTGLSWAAVRKVPQMDFFTRWKGSASRPFLKVRLTKVDMGGQEIYSTWYSMPVRYLTLVRGLLRPFTPS